MSLAPRSCYLAGPIDHCTEQEIHGWRDKAALLLSPMHTFNPARRQFHKTMTSDDYKEIVTLDKAEIAASDALLVNYNPPSAGPLRRARELRVVVGRG